MKRIFIRLWVAITAFCLGICVSTLWGLYTLPNLPRKIEVLETPVSAVTIEPPLPEMHACGPEGNFHSYTLPDGSHVSIDCYHLKSRRAAVREFQRRLREAGTVIERSEGRQLDDEIVSEVVVAVGERATELELTGETVCVTSAPSLTVLRSRQW